MENKDVNNEEKVEKKDNIFKKTGNFFNSL